MTRLCSSAEVPDPATSAEAERQRLFQEAARVIRAEIARPGLTLGQVAEQVAVSPRQLQRIFAEQAGMPFSAYLLGERAREAEALLARDVPARHAAWRLGYSSGSALRKALRRAADQNAARNDP